MIYLTNSAGVVVETTTADDGSYTFQNLAADTYSLYVGQVDGYRNVPPVAGDQGGDVDYATFAGFSNIQIGEGVSGSGYKMGLHDMSE